MSEGPVYLTDEYLARVKAFLTANRIQFVDNDELASKFYLHTLPWVDPRSLVHAPSVDVEDIPRDAILLKLAGVSDPSLSDLRRVHSAFMRTKMSFADDFVVRFLKEVKR